MVNYYAFHFFPQTRGALHTADIDDKRILSSSLDPDGAVHVVLRHPHIRADGRADPLRDHVLPGAVLPAAAAGL